MVLVLILETMRTNRGRGQERGGGRSGRSWERRQISSLTGSRASSRYWGRPLWSEMVV